MLCARQNAQSCTITQGAPQINAIAGAWAILKQRLESTAPTDFESRPEFLTRLRRAVTWLNENRHDDFLKLCANRKERARDVIHKHQGGKSKW